VALEDVILELLGPRWRREARLALGDEAPRAQRTLTPASFHSVTLDTPSSETGQSSEAGDAGNGEAAAGGRAVPRTISGPSVQTPPPTIAPSRRRERSNTTIFRLARRHRDIGEDEGPVSPDVMRRRVIAGAIVVAMIVAAVVGVVLAKPHKPVHHGPTQAQIRAAQQRAAAARQKAAAAAAADKQLNTILTKLAITRTRNLTRSINEQTPSSQVRDFATVQKAYVSAVHKVAPFESKTPKAAPLARTLTTIANDYGRIAAAGRHNDAKAFNRAYKTMQGHEGTLRSEVAEL
jgi:hypothetical protein